MDNERTLVLFREMVIEKIIDNQVDFEYPRTCFLSVIIDFKEKYGFGIFSKFSYDLLVEEFMGAISQYTSIFDFDINIDQLRKKMSPQHPSKTWVTPPNPIRSSWADYHENRAP